MSVLVLQLGDIHIKVDSDEILRRGEQIAAAAAAEADSEVDAACILVTGDVAQTGAEEEFRLAIEFLSAIRDGLAKKLGCPVQIITIPGNHDLHLADDQTGAIRSSMEFLPRPCPRRRFSISSWPRNVTTSLSRTKFPRPDSTSRTPSPSFGPCEFSPKTARLTFIWSTRPGCPPATNPPVPFCFPWTASQSMARARRRIRFPSSITHSTGSASRRRSGRCATRSNTLATWLSPGTNTGMLASQRRRSEQRASCNISKAACFRSETTNQSRRSPFWFSTSKTSSNGSSVYC